MEKRKISISQRQGKPKRMNSLTTWEIFLTFDIIISVHSVRIGAEITFTKRTMSPDSSSGDEHIFLRVRERTRPIVSIFDWIVQQYSC